MVPFVFRSKHQTPLLVGSLTGMSIDKAWAPQALYSVAHILEIGNQTLCPPWVNLRDQTHSRNRIKGKKKKSILSFNTKAFPNQVSPKKTHFWKPKKRPMASKYDFSGDPLISRTKFLGGSLKMSGNFCPCLPGSRRQLCYAGRSLLFKD